MLHLRLIRSALILAASLLLLARTDAAKWQVSDPQNVAIDTSAVPVAELSGVTYLGPSAVAGHYDFAAVQDDGGKLIRLDVELSAAGSLISVRSAASLTMSTALDFEGAAYTNPERNSVFLSDENNPGVREFDLTTGSQLQSVSIPSVFASRRGNRGFESLTRSPDGTRMWTANEEALTIDGPVATSSHGTTVRLLQLNAAGNSVTSAAQYAYDVEKIHGTSTLGSPQSGLSDLVALPDGTLLALERSVSLASPLYLNRIFEVDSSTATDISVAPFASGLMNQTYTPVSKSLLWSGAADGSNGQNLEGLALGPRLANGDWVMLGVVDNGDGFSMNTVVSFLLSAQPSADFDNDGDVDGRDFLSWQRGFGKTQGAMLSDGDADRDGAVDDADLVLWATSYTAGAATAILSVPEPTSFWWLLGSLLMIVRQR